jgi:hypothetical protein
LRFDIDVDRIGAASAARPSGINPHHTLCRSAVARYQVGFAWRLLAATGSAARAYPY